MLNYVNRLLIIVENEKLKGPEVKEQRLYHSCNKTMGRHAKHVDNAAHVLFAV